MDISLLRRVYDELALPLMENHLKNTRDHRVSENSWPRRCILSDTCKPFTVQNKATKKEELVMICLIPPTKNFWSVWLAMYILYGDPKFFKTHARACRSLLKEVKEAKRQIHNLTDLQVVWEWLHRSADGMMYNTFLEDPVQCIANIRNEFMVANKVLPEEKLLNPDLAIKLVVQKEFNILKSKWKKEKEEKSERERIAWEEEVLEGKNDRQGQGDDQHCLEGERRPRSGDGDGSLDRASDGDAENQTDNAN